MTPRHGTRIANRRGVALVASLAFVLAATACSDDTTSTATSSSTSTPAAVDATTATTTTTDSASLTTTTARRTSTTTAVTTTTAAAPAPTTSCFEGSSPSGFDAKKGTYAVWVTGLDVASRKVTFDVVQFLVGTDAAKAFKAAHPDETDGPPNDYFITNANTQLRTAVALPGVGVYLVRLATTSDASLKPGTFAELPAYSAETPPYEGHLSPNPFWLTMSNGSISRICEQFVP